MDPFVLTAIAVRFSREGEHVPIGRRGARLLRALLGRAGEVLTKSELLDVGWPGLAVEESNLSVQIAQLRKALGPSPEGGEWIITIPRVGYRFRPPAPEKAGATPPRNGERPSIAILPFAHLGPEPDRELFADGLVDDIINTLSKLSGLTVIAHNSSLFYKGRETDIREIARDLGVRYVLQGSLQKSGDRIRISVRLSDVERAAAIWAERYDRGLSDLFAIRDEIALRLATDMQVIFMQGEEARLQYYTTTTNVEAWACYVKGLATIFWPDRQTKPGEDMAIACRHWERALAHDPHSAALHAMLGFAHTWNARFGWWGDRKAYLASGTMHIEKALSIDPTNAEALVSSAIACLMEARFDEAVGKARRAVDLAPGAPKIATFAGYVFTATGLAQEAIAQIEKAIRLNPHFPQLYLSFLGNAYRLAGRMDEAIATLEEYSARMPGFGGRDLVIAYERSGRHDEAKDAAARLLKAVPDFTISGWIATQFRSDTTEFEADIAALRAAGLPD
ncbi:hypothetical protein FXV83_27530 [Bradyrhizobium hipponense]|uniref:OmpR/PhoB-type domain-containing protein n=1 Tax=Bradyrhizobium hipponense TaxID=2605638 RepID=A0A5S4YH49_9BRAD|nr:hypothetical protein FXV83_27530 [Bradyrhizobium hipponense]